MSVATNRGVSGAAGTFATSRRGGVSAYEVEQARARLGARATPAQIAKMLGRCEADIRAIMFPASKNDPEPIPEAAWGAPWSIQDQKLLQLMYIEMGCTAEQTASALGRTVDAVHRRVRKTGLQRGRLAA